LYVVKSEDEICADLWLSFNDCEFSGGANVFFTIERTQH
jgi:hypothetical protein